MNPDAAGRIVGSGNYKQKAEKIFVPYMVDSACVQLERGGTFQDVKDANNANCYPMIV